jgi:hypothetical protein
MLINFSDFLILLLRDKATVGKLFAELGPRFKERPGGYLRILKCGFRPGDSAPMAIVELVGRAIQPVAMPKKTRKKDLPSAAPMAG